MTSKIEENLKKIQKSKKINPKIEMTSKIEENQKIEEILKNRRDSQVKFFFANFEFSSIF